MSDGPEAEKKALTIDDLPWYTVPAILLGVPALLAILSSIAPSIFFDKFVDPYFWQPIQTDLGYNPVNTVAWALLLLVSLVGLAQMMTALKINVDNTFIFGSVAWVVTGSVVRVLEDTELFIPPLQYFMITPPIFLLFGVFAVIALLIGIYIRWIGNESGREQALQKMWMVQAIFVLIYLLFWAGEWSQITIYVSPLVVALLAVLNHFIIRYRVTKVGEIRPAEIMLMLSIAPFLLAMVYVFQFIEAPWSPSGRGIPTSFILAPLLAIGITGWVVNIVRTSLPDSDHHPRFIWGSAIFFAGLLGISVWTAPEATRTEVSAQSVMTIVAFALLLAGVGILVSRRLQASKIGKDKLVPYLLPINIFLIISQLMDGFATSLGLDLAGYREKHVLSKFIIDGFRSFSETIGWEFGAAYPTFLAFVPIKLAISLAVIYAIDVASKEDMEKYPNMLGLVKFAIIMVGIGPAVRDFGRLSLGV